MNENGNVDESGKRGRIALIAAIGAHDRSLGKSNDLLWKIPADLDRFRALTRNHPVIMGRKTWESLPENRRPLPSRTNIVVTRQSDYAAPGATVANSLDSALAAAKDSAGSDEIFIIGGGQLFKESLPVADTLYLTLIDAQKEADSFFPEYENIFTKETFREEGVSPDDINYAWINFEKS